MRKKNTEALSLSLHLSGLSLFPDILDSSYEVYSLSENKRKELLYQLSILLTNELSDKTYERSDQFHQKSSALLFILDRCNLCQVILFCFSSCLLLHRLVIWYTTSSRASEEKMSVSHSSVIFSRSWIENSSVLSKTRRSRQVNHLIPSLSKPLKNQGLRSSSSPKTTFLLAGALTSCWR